MPLWHSGSYISSLTALSCMVCPPPLSPSLTLHLSFSIFLISPLSFSLSFFLISLARSLSLSYPGAQKVSGCDITHHSSVTCYPSPHDNHTASVDTHTHTPLDCRTFQPPSTSLTQYFMWQYFILSIICLFLWCFLSWCVRVHLSLSLSLSHLSLSLSLPLSLSLSLPLSLSLSPSRAHASVIFFFTCSFRTFYVLFPFSIACLSPFFSCFLKFPSTYFGVTTSQICTITFVMCTSGLFCARDSEDSGFAREGIA